MFDLSYFPSGLSESSSFVALLLAPVARLWRRERHFARNRNRSTGRSRLSRRTVELLDGTSVAQETTTDAAGNYIFHVQKSARYQVRAVAPTFQTTTSDAVFVTASGKAQVDITLATQTLTQQVTVTATGTPTPDAQIGAPVSVLTADQYRYSTEVQDPLRLIPGAQVTQTGQVGGTTGLSIRGGNINANKVLIDGVPANDIGGAVEFANFDTVGIDKIEVLAGAEQRALWLRCAGRRGEPDDGSRQHPASPADLLRRWRQLQYLSPGGHAERYAIVTSITTRPLPARTRATICPTIPSTTRPMRATLAGPRIPPTICALRCGIFRSAADQPNAILLYGIPDDASVKEQDSYYSAAWNNQTTEKWHNQIRYGGLRLNYNYTDFAATGIL